MTSCTIYMQQLIADHFKPLNLTYDPYDIHKYENFLLLMQKWNKAFNLTSILNPKDMIERHLVESLAFGPYLSGSNIVDIGSGAGIPGVPLAISNPDKNFVLIESRAKRARFLRHVSGELGLSNVEVEESRAERVSLTKYFDTAVVKAVADPFKLFSLVKHLLNNNGIILVLAKDGLLDDDVSKKKEFELIDIKDPLIDRLKGSLIRIKRSN